MNMAVHIVIDRDRDKKKPKKFKSN